MMQVVGTPVRVSATGAVLRTSGYLIGVLCNSSTSGTLTLRDDTAGSATPFANAIPMTAESWADTWTDKFLLDELLDRHVRNS